ncbi:hypothetical protein [Streptomyces candidus]|uniref:DUF2812 domain-containing protein n=1 Tax=Streptomyces candidus TaxID=67283 RepID=A0A7X0HIP2_9ACTN|nr:hypothetical protein [Streptomyces candidus]MBB6438275.1 hypothetical protein [Streptomyces candidus]GHH51796.1 hypothetical protein GCM10018773_50780 [Streptomyces candidus]
MMTVHATYFDRLGTALRASGRPADEVAAIVAELAAHLADADGADPVEEFGAPEEFAARLTGGAEVAGPATGAETWKWTTDIYNDRRLLNQYGDQGWEVERLDRLGRFVCRRDPADALRWEYCRAMANGAAERAARTAELAPDAWEPCGHWAFYMYFKRPKAASAGPAAALDALARTPAEHVMFGGRVRRVLVVTGLLALVAVVALVCSDYGDFVAAHPWSLAVFAAAGVAGGLGGWYGTKRDVAKGVEE